MAARVSITLDEDVLKDVIAELRLSNPPSFTLNHSGRHAELVKEHAKVRGFYEPGNNHVGITTQGESFEKEGIVVMTKHLRFTILHELRHAYQREHWTAEQLATGRCGPYELRKVELDANLWAEYAMPVYPKLVVVKRQTIGKSGLSRMNERARA
jgi:hypothetical protein